MMATESIFKDNTKEFKELVFKYYNPHIRYKIYNSYYKLISVIHEVCDFKGEKKKERACFLAILLDPSELQEEEMKVDREFLDKAL